MPHSISRTRRWWRWMMALRLHSPPPFPEVCQKETSFTWFRDGLQMPGHAQQELVIGAPQPEDSGIYTVVATNASGFAASSFDLQVSVDPYVAWAAFHSLTGTDAQPDEDPDRDGFTNRQEFAFGTDPTRPTGGSAAPCATGPTSSSPIWPVKPA